MLVGHNGVLALRGMSRLAPLIPKELARRIGNTARRLLCGLHGHARVLHAEPTRLSLRCLRCGAETPGWTIQRDPRFHGLR